MLTNVQSVLYKSRPSVLCNSCLAVLAEHERPQFTIPRLHSTRLLPFFATACAFFFHKREGFSSFQRWLQWLPFSPIPQTPPFPTIGKVSGLLFLADDSLSLPIRTRYRKTQICKLRISWELIKPNSRKLVELLVDESLRRAKKTEALSLPRLISRRSISIGSVFSDCAINKAANPLVGATKSLGKPLVGDKEGSMLTRLKEGLGGTSHQFFIRWVIVKAVEKMSQTVILPQGQ